jgi:ferredoxin-NADP reductase
MKRYKISDIKALAPSTNRYRLKPIEEEIDYMAGQFAFIHLLDENNGSIVKIPYSIASAPGDELEFCIKIVGGALTKRLDQMKVGDIVGIEQAGGHFAYNDEKKVGMIAGGTGIAPIMSILRDAAKRNIEGEFVLFYSTRSKDSIIYREELEKLNKDERFRIIITLTRDEWEGETGRVSKEMIERHVPDATALNWWICGPLSMAKERKDELISLGVEPKQIKIEGWG